MPSIPWWNRNGPATAIWPGAPRATFTALLALYVAFGLCLGGAPMQDLPNHLTRAHIIADLLFDHGAVFGDAFVLKLTFSPYLAGDLLLASLDRALGSAWACRVWIAATVGLLPVSVWFALRKQEASTIAAGTAAVLALYVATDHFFILGFSNYLISVACAFFAYGCFCAAARTGRVSAYSCFVLLLLLSYVVHLTALVFITAITAVSVVFWILNGRISVRRAAALIAPPLLLVAWQLATAPAIDLFSQAMHIASADVGEPTAHWRTAAVGKIHGLAFPAARFNTAADLVLFAGLIAVALFPILLSWRAAIRVSAEQLLIACALGFLFLLTPYSVGGVDYASPRVLQYALLFLILAGIRCGELRPGVSRVQFASAAILALANLAYTAVYMLPQNAVMERYKALAVSIPRGARVLPVDTLQFQYYSPFLHAGSYATLYSHALTPYLFAGDTVPNMPYFLYRERPYAPAGFWYFLGGNRVSWKRVAQEYQYLLVTVPWAAQKIPISYSVISRNDAAALLKLQDR